MADRREEMEAWYAEMVAELGAWIRREEPSERAIAERADCSRDRARRLAQRARAGEDLPQQLKETGAPGGDRELTAKGGRIRTLGQLLDAAKVDTDEWTVKTWTANAWEQNSVAQGLVTLHQVKASLERRRVPLRPPATRFVPPKDGPGPAPRAGKLWVFLPDSQHGIRWVGDRFQAAVTMHDPAAVDVSIQLIKHLRPDGVGLLGDMADFAEVSLKFPRDPSITGTTQAAVDLLYYDLCRIRAAAPKAEILWSEGNHDDRPTRALRQTIPALDGLRPAGSRHPMGDVSHLLNLDSLGIELVGPYSDHRGHYIGDVKGDPRSVIDMRHGDLIRSDGVSSGSAVLKATTHHRVRGHDHRRWLASKTVHGHIAGLGPTSWEVHAMSPGCLCRIGGIVPGVGAEEDWQQGIGLAWVHEDRVFFELVPIQGGRAVYGGRVFTGDPDLTGAAESTGWTQLLAV